jgi:hypothetical protein
MNTATAPEKTLSETSYNLGVPVVGGTETDGNHNSNFSRGPMQGHKCCGGCCDMRRAVIIVNALNLVFVAVGLFRVLAMKKNSANANDMYDVDDDDDEVVATMMEFGNIPLAGFIVLTCARLLCSVIGIVGAVQYNIYMVGVGAAGYVIDAVMALVLFQLIGFFYYVFFAYPHLFFISEVRKGIMSKENYPNEDYSWLSLLCILLVPSIFLHF